MKTLVLAAGLLLAQPAPVPPESAPRPAAPAAPVKPRFPAKELSADLIVRRAGQKDEQGRLYIGKEKLRSELNSHGSTLAFVYDATSGKSFMLLPEHRAAMDLSSQTEAALKLGKHGPVEFLPAPEGDPCWRKVEGRVCAKVGSQPMNGRETDKWKVTDKDGQVSLIWMDRSLKLPVKTETPVGGTELRNIQEGPQPPELFQLPKGYRMLSSTVAPNGAVVPGRVAPDDAEPPEPPPPPGK